MNQKLRNAAGYPNRMLAFYLQQIEQHNRLLQQVRRQLPTALAEQVRHCLISNGQLVVYASGAVWASQLRFHGETLLGKIACDPATPIRKVKIKVVDKPANHPRLSQQVSLPSLTTLRMLKQQAAAIADPQLQASMQRLCTTLTNLASREKLR